MIYRRISGPCFAKGSPGQQRPGRALELQGLWRPGPLPTNSLWEGCWCPPGTSRGAQHVVSTLSAAGEGVGAPAGGHRSSVPPPFRVRPAYWQSLWPQFLPWAPAGRELAPKKDCGDPNREPVQNCAWTR